MNIVFHEDDPVELCWLVVMAGDETPNPAEDCEEEVDEAETLDKEDELEDCDEGSDEFAERAAAGVVDEGLHGRDEGEELLLLICCALAFANKDCCSLRSVSSDRPKLSRLFFLRFLFC